MKLPTPVIVVGAVVLISSGAATSGMDYLTQNPIPTWLGLLFVVPATLVGFLAIAKGNIDAEDERSERD